jgi:hypothetical protein
MTETIMLTEDLVQKCEDYARSVIAHYSQGEHPHTMPWSRNLMTDDELREWLASRKEAGAKIDIKTCEIGHWYANANGDPYGIRDLLGEEDHLEKGYTDKFNWVRSPDSNGWICEGDLPPEKGKALYDRIYRKAPQK